MSHEDRRQQIQTIVNAAYDKRWVEIDKHGHRWDPEVGGVCRCGWTPARPMGAHARVSVGVHIARKRQVAEKACREEISREMAATR